MSSSAASEARPGTSITLSGLGKSFGGGRVIDDVSLTIAPGEVISLLGPSGSGKTTLLRIIAGLERADKGSIHFDDTDAATMSVQQRRVGFVFQHYALFRHMRVADNIAYGLKVRPRSLRPAKDRIAARVGELLDLVQLQGLGRRYPMQLSGGQRQRVALARAIAIEPRVLLLDEPFGALDVKVRRELRRWLRDLHDQTGLTTIFVTHDQDEAMDISDRVAVLNNGRLEQIGTPAELYERPASPFVLSFIGEAVALDIVVTRNGFIHEGRPITAATEGLAEGPARLFLRTQDVTLDRPGAGLITARIARKWRTASGEHAEFVVGNDPSSKLAWIGECRQASGEQVGLALSGRPAIYPITKADRVAAHFTYGSE